jgi:hypothetical protein
MTRQFSLPTLFRMLPNDLLAEFFARLDNPCWSMDWDHRPQRNVESVLQCLNYFPPRQRESAELILRNVFDLACESGLHALHDAGRQLNSTAYLKALPDSMNAYGQAMWSWLKHPDVFEYALLFQQVERLSWWRKRDDLPSVTPETDADSLRAMASDVMRLLTKEQGRGQRCTIEHAHRDDDTDYFFCFPDDYVKTVLVHDQRDRLITKSLRQTFEIIFAYRQQQGVLELHARVPARLKNELEEAFAWNILGERIGPRIPRRTYDLNRLKERRFDLTTDPSDPVHVELRKVRLNLPDGVRRITLESSKARGGEDVFNMVDECLNQNSVGLDNVEISLATFRFHFSATNTHRRGSITFDVAHPNQCNLRSHRPERVAVARKHLKLWRIACD